jgi:drug/metabolite transporter (DMT)-like permease
MAATTGDRVMILLAAVLFSTGGAAVKTCAMTGWQVASFRSGVAALAVLLMLPAARRGWSARTWAVGAAYASTLTLYILANKLTTAANTIFLQGTAPLYILVFGPLLLREHSRARDLGLMLVLGGGMTLFFVGRQPVLATAPEPMLGNALAVAAGVCWALTIMGLRWLQREPGHSSGAAAVACGNVIAFAAILPMALTGAAGDARDWLMIVYLGVLQVGLAYVFLTRGMRRVPAFETSLLLLAEPVLNPAWAWLVHGELPTRWASLGGAIILGATALRTFAERRPGGSPDGS